LRITRTLLGDESFLQPGQQRHQKNRRGYGERDAQRGHEGKAFAQL
jgi:hypothetical protein